MYGALHGSTLTGDVFGDAGAFGDVVDDLKAAADKICANVTNADVQNQCKVARDAAAAAATAAPLVMIPGVGIAVPFIVGGAAAVLGELKLLGGSCDGYVPPDDRGELPTAVANEMYKIDYMIVNLPDGARCTGRIGDAIDAARTGAWNTLVDKWNTLTPTQQAAANKQAAPYAANPPLDTVAPWVNWKPGDEIVASGFTATMNNAAAAAAARNAASVLASQQAAAALLQASQAQAALAAHASAQGDSINAQKSATASKNLQLLANMHSGGAVNRDGTAKVSSGSHAGLIVGTLLVAAAAGGFVYYKYGRKKK
jgi:hypothetical protein